MKTNVAETSLAAYRAMEGGGELAPKEQAVLQALTMAGPLTREQIAHLTGMKEGSACGRVAKLLELELVEYHDTVLNPVTKKPNERVRIARRQAVLPGIEVDQVAA